MMKEAKEISDYINRKNQRFYISVSRTCCLDFFCFYFIFLTKLVAPDPFFYKFQNLKSKLIETNVPLKHVRNLIGKPNFEQSHTDHMNSTSRPVRKACNN